MTLLLTVVGHLITLVAAIVALTGHGWDRSKKGLHRLTTTGRIAVVIAFIGICFSGFQSIDQYLTRTTYNNIAMDSIRIGWAHAASPWILTLEVITDKDLAVVTANNLKKVPTESNLEKFDNFDFRQTARPKEYGSLTLGQLFCHQSSLGMRTMEKSVQQNQSVLPLNLVTTIKKLRKKKAVW